MSSYQEFANATGLLESNKGRAIAQGQLDKGNIYGGLVAGLGASVPLQVKQAIEENQQKRQQAQIQAILRESGGDFNAALPRIAQINPGMAMAFQKELTAADEVKNKATELKAKHQQEMREFGLKTLSTAQSEGEWASGIKGMHDAGLDVSWIDPTFTPDSAKRIQSMLGQKEGDFEYASSPEGIFSKKTGVVSTPTITKSTKPKTWAEMALDAQDTESPTHDISASALAAHEKVSAPKSVTPGSFEDYILKKYGPQATPEQILEGRGKYGQADDRTAGSQAADITNLTSKGLDIAALNYKKTGVMPALGMGDRTTRQRIINRAAELTPDDAKRIEAGGGDLAGNRADYKADTTSLTALQRQRDAIGAFENTAKKNIDQFLAVAAKVPDTGIPLLNTPARWIAGAGGSADVAQYNAARQVAISEIAKIVQNPNLTGQLSDSARHEIEVFNPANATLKQTVAVMKLLKQDMANRASSLDDQIKNTRGRIGGGSNTAPAPTLRYNPATGKVEPIQ